MRAAFSRRQTCHSPGKYVDRPASSSRTAVATASRNHRSCATSTTAASIPTSVLSSHSRRSTSRWFVGSSRRSRSGSPAKRPRQRRAGQLAAGERLQGPVELLLGEAEPAQRRERVLAPRVAACMLEPGLRRGVSRQRLGTVVTGRHRGFEPSVAPPPARSGRGRRRARIRARTNRGREAAAGRAARCGSPCRGRAGRRRSRSRPPASGAGSSCPLRSGRRVRAVHAARP